MKKKYTAPLTYILEYSPGNVMGAEVSIPKSDETEDEAWDSDDYYAGSWENIWSGLYD